jgi:hypothetical protein
MSAAAAWCAERGLHFTPGPGEQEVTLRCPCQGTLTVHEKGWAWCSTCGFAGKTFAAVDDLLHGRVPPGKPRRMRRVRP